MWPFKKKKSAKMKEIVISRDDERSVFEFCCDQCPGGGGYFRALLKRYVGEKEFKRYLKFGYITMDAHGYHWRIPCEGNRIVNMVEQYEKDMLNARYCVHFQDYMIPPTDTCIMRMALVNAGIDVLRASSNVYEKNQRISRAPAVSLPGGGRIDALGDLDLNIDGDTVSARDIVVEYGPSPLFGAFNALRAEV